MNVPGFTLLLQEFCSYCPDFEPEVEKIDCSSLTEQVKYCTNIRCTQRAEMCKTCYKHSKAGNHRCLSLTPSTTLELLLKP